MSEEVDSSFDMRHLHVGDRIEMELYRHGEKEGEQGETVIWQGLVVVAGDAPTIAVIDQNVFHEALYQLLGTYTLELDTLSPFQPRQLIFHPFNTYQLVCTRVGYRDNEVLQSFDLYSFRAYRHGSKEPHWSSPEPNSEG